MTGVDLAKEVLQELEVLSQNEAPTAADAVAVLGFANRVLDNWNAERQAVFADLFQTFTLIPGTNPHTIGPTGANFTVTQRPVAIAGANIIVPTDIRVGLRMQNADWWFAQTTPTVASSIPTDCFYNPTWSPTGNPNGAIYLYPVPDAAYGLELHTRIVLAAIAPTTNFTLPPGYHDAFVLTVAEKAARTFGAEITDDLRRGASTARARIFENNRSTPPLMTHDAGIPSTIGPRRPTFNWLNGSLT